MSWKSAKGLVLTKECGHFLKDLIQGGLLSSSTSTCTLVHVCLHTYIHICTPVILHMCRHTHTSTHTHECTCARAHTHTHTHSQLYRHRHFQNKCQRTPFSIYFVCFNSLCGFFPPSIHMIFIHNHCIVSTDLPFPTEELFCS